MDFQGSRNTVPKPQLVFDGFFPPCTPDLSHDLHLPQCSLTWPSSLAPSHSTASTSLVDAGLPRSHPKPTTPTTYTTPPFDLYSPPAPTLPWRAPALQHPSRLQWLSTTDCLLWQSWTRRVSRQAASPQVHSTVSRQRTIHILSISSSASVPFPVNVSPTTQGRPHSFRLQHPEINPPSRLQPSNNAAANYAALLPDPTPPLVLRYQ